MILFERAPAKINLSLRIIGRRPDGFHDLDSVVAFAESACDSLSLDPSQPDGLDIRGPFASELSAADNLVLTAVQATKAAFPAARCGRVTLEKCLPVAAGIGGGSADAAATLRLLRRANPETDRADAVWQAIAEQLGSDVPVCVESRLSRMTGRGERVMPLPARALPAAVLVNPRVAVPANKTAAVFKARAAGTAEGGLVERDGQSGRTVEGSGALDLVQGVNDLEGPAREVMPVIGDVLLALIRLTGARAVRLSGAGPTCFALFDTLDDARRAADDLRALQPHWWVAATALR